MTEAKATLNTRPWDLGGDGVIKDDQTVFTNAGRTTDLLFLTVMAKIAIGGKLVPLTDVAAVDGTAFPAGIFMGTDIPFADIVAGDVTDQDLLIGKDKMIDEDMIVLENSLTLDTPVTAIADGDKTIRQYLQDMGIYPRKSKNDQQTQPIN